MPRCVNVRPGTAIWPRSFGSYRLRVSPGPPGRALVRPLLSSPRFQQGTCRHVQCRRRAARGRLVSNARAEASRQNGARSRGPKTEEGKARSAQNALKHGMRAQKHLVLPDEDAAEFAGTRGSAGRGAGAGWRAAGRARARVAVAAWRLARADRIEIELFEERQDRAGRARARPDPGRQRRALVRDAAALSRRGAWPSSGARPAHAQGAPGRRGGQAHSALAAPRCGPRPVTAADRANRTNPSAPWPDRNISERATRVRCPARARRALAAERTRDWPHRPRAVGRPQPNAPRAPPGLSQP